MKKINDTLFINILLSFLSAGFGFLLVNLFLITYISNNNQANRFPRSLLGYLPAPTASWNYPDLNSKATRKLILIGDSYGEGSGDAFLNNIYDYSSAHFIKNNINFEIILASNSGSFLPLQVLRLEEAFKGNYTSNKIHEYFRDGKGKINIIALFYEGNDLADLIKNKDYLDRNSWEKQKVKRYINKHLPLINFTNNVISKLTKELFHTFTNTSNKELKSTNLICRNQQCRKFPPLQSAAPDLTEEQINSSIDITSNSLINFKRKYNANLCLIYLPSPATLYSPEIIYFQEDFQTKNSFILSSTNKRKSEYIRSRLSSNLEKAGINFSDSTVFFKTYTDINFIHGIKDPNHFNQYGYKLLAEFITQNIKKCI